MRKALKHKMVVCSALCLATDSALAGTYAVPGQYATIQAVINAASDNSIIKNITAGSGAAFAVTGGKKSVISKTPQLMLVVLVCN